MDRCDCLNECGDDPRLKSGQVRKCESYAFHNPPRCPMCQGSGYAAEHDIKLWHEQMEAYATKAYAEGRKDQAEESNIIAAELTVETRQFLSDVVTAAGLLRHGKTDKALATRISDKAYALMGVPKGPTATAPQCPPPSPRSTPGEAGSSHDGP